MLKIASIVGARPQFIKAKPIINELAEKRIKHVLIHTGQHYDYEMSKVFFDELNINKPDYNLGVGSHAAGKQTGLMLAGIEKTLLKEKPDVVIVYGDTNTTLAAALAAVKLHISVAHVEAGLRSYNKDMPEEVNRVLTDHASSVLFCPTEAAVMNLQKEGFDNIANHGCLIDDSFEHSGSSGRRPLIINVGDVMYDIFLSHFAEAREQKSFLAGLGLDPGKYALATVHRAENADNPEHLRSIFAGFETLAEQGISVVIPLHPRTQNTLKRSGISPERLFIMPPVSYDRILCLEANAKAVLTDSGGMQKEAYWLGVPCVTLREETEWVETVQSGWNALAGYDPGRIAEAALRTRPDSAKTLFYGDGYAARRIVRCLAEFR